MICHFYGQSVKTLYLNNDKFTRLALWSYRHRLQKEQTGLEEKFHGLLRALLSLREVWSSGG